MLFVVCGKLLISRIHSTVCDRGDGRTFAGMVLWLKGQAGVGGWFVDESALPDRMPQTHNRGRKAMNFDREANDLPVNYELLFTHVGGGGGGREFVQKLVGWLGAASFRYPTAERVQRTAQGRQLAPPAGRWLVLVWGGKGAY